MSSAVTKNTLYLVRHGENPANVRREFSYKILDYSLNERGVRQAEQTAAYFSNGDVKVDVIFSSPLKRAMETAQIIGQLLYGGMIVMLLDTLGNGAYQVAVLSLLVTMLIGLWLVWPVRDDTTAANTNIMIDAIP